MTAPANDSGRGYVVLRGLATAHQTAPASFEIVGTVEATSSRQAVRRWAEADDELGTFTVVAVAARSFRPKTATRRTKRTLVLSRVAEAES